MRPSKAVSVEEYRVIGRYEHLRRTLLGAAYARHRDKPLAYWALPTDRRLPLAFLGRTLGDLLHTPFAQLSATPGIGDKKLGSFVKLLSRAAQTDPSDLPVEIEGPGPGGNVAGAQGGTGEARACDPAAVSEVEWSNWRASVIRHGLGAEKLGRFAPTLRELTRVIWDRPLGFYAGHTLAGIRAMKTHGERRVRAILEVFRAVHALVAGMGVEEHLVVRIAPRRIEAVEAWIGRVLQGGGAPAEEELTERLVVPLMEQVRADATPQTALLAETRLGLRGPVPSVRQMARQMGLTRARVYQLLNDVHDIIAVRWPSGRCQMYDLKAHLEATCPVPPGAAVDPCACLERLRAAVELFYPGGRRGAAVPVEAPQFSAPPGTDGRTPDEEDAEGVACRLGAAEE